jgi:hypothetical protein
MNLQELETMIRDGIKAHPEKSPLALLTENGIKVPPEFHEAVQSLANRSGDDYIGPVNAEYKHNWIGG